MSKSYRKFAVEKAVQEWESSDDWFSADALLPRAIQSLPQSHMHMNVFAVAKALCILEKKGALEGRKRNGIKEYRRAGVWDGRSHFHA
jgi:hypothetical protein